jgi:chromosome segregation ATPase
MQQTQGAYRTSAKNPHKAAYDRDESLRRLRKNAGFRIRRLKARLDSWMRAHQEMAGERDQLHGQLMSLKSEAWKLMLTIGFTFIAFIGLAFFFVNRMDELEAANDRLAIERAELAMENDALMAENADLRADLVLAERRENECGLDGLVTRSQLRACQQSVEDMRLTAARLDGRISTLEVLCARGSVQAMHATDDLVVDEYGVTCHDSELLGPEGTCPL